MSEIETDAGRAELEKELEALYRITTSLGASPLDLDATVQEVTDLATRSIVRGFAASPLANFLTPERLD